MIARRLRGASPAAHDRRERVRNEMKILGIVGSMRKERATETLVRRVIEAVERGDVFRPFERCTELASALAAAADGRRGAT
jgi:hypothetical protein